jgi:hypothetical protein
VSAFRDEVAAARARREVVRQELLVARTNAVSERAEAAAATERVAALEQELAALDARLPRIERDQRREAARRLHDESARGLSARTLIAVVAVALLLGMAIMLLAR